MSGGTRLRWLSAIASGDVELFGYNDASLGEMFQHVDLADNRVPVGSASEHAGAMDP